MSERRPFRLDLAATGLLLAGLLVALCVFSHDPADGGNGRVFPPPATTHNLLGPAGAALAAALFETLGVAVYVLLASWFVLVVLLFLRRSWFKWVLRLLGWLLLIPCAAVVADYLGPDGFGGGLTGGGGSLGAWLTAWMEVRLLPVGRILLVAGCVLLCLVLT